MWHAKHSYRPFYAVAVAIYPGIILGSGLAFAQDVFPDRLGHACFIVTARGGKSA